MKPGVTRAPSRSITLSGLNELSPVSGTYFPILAILPLLRYTSTFSCFTKLSLRSNPTIDLTLVNLMVFANPLWAN
jgi:hypothetical protein